MIVLLKFRTFLKSFGKWPWYWYASDYSISSTYISQKTTRMKVIKYDLPNLPSYSNARYFAIRQVP